MESIQILGKVQIKQIVTEQYKEKTSADFRKAIETVDGELANFDKDMNKTLTELTLKAHPQAGTAAQTVQSGKRKDRRLQGAAALKHQRDR